MVDLLLEQDFAIGTRVLNRDVGGHAGESAQFALEADTVEIVNTDMSAGEPDLARVRRPGESLQTGPIRRELLLVSCQIDDSHGATIIARGVAMIEESDVLPIG